jgi:hypothetical protein
MARMAGKVTELRFPTGLVLRSGAASALMGLAAYAVVRSLPPVPGLIAGVLTGAAVFIPLTRIFGYLLPGDQVRFAKLAERLPGGMKRGVLPVLAFMAGPGRKAA